MEHATGPRPYVAIAARLKAGGTREARMKAVVEALWDALRDQGVSWVGFYVEQPGAPDDRRLVLGPCRNKPACSPMGVHGVCGQALRFRRPRIVEDVTKLGPDYVACDPLDRSEITVPLLDLAQRAWGVLDLDSHEFGAFDENDAVGLRIVLDAAGL